MLHTAKLSDPFSLQEKIATCSKYSNSFFDRSEQASSLFTLTAGKR
jgi:hypothetical protein